MPLGFLSYLQVAHLTSTKWRHSDASRRHLTEEGLGQSEASIAQMADQHTNPGSIRHASERRKRLKRGVEVVESGAINHDHPSLHTSVD